MARKLDRWSSPTITTTGTFFCTADVPGKGCDRPAFVIDLGAAGAAYCDKHATKKHIREGWSK